LNGPALPFSAEKALSFALPLLNDDGYPKESGKTLKDIEKVVLDKMFELLIGKAYNDDPQETDADDCANPAKSPNESDKVFTDDFPNKDDMEDDTEDGTNRPSDYILNG